MKVGDLVSIRRTTGMRGIITKLTDTGRYATVRVVHDGSTWHGTTISLEVIRGKG